MSIVYHISQRNKTSLCLLFDHQLTLPYVIGAGHDKFFSQGHFLIEPDVKKFNPDFSLDLFLTSKVISHAQYNCILSRQESDPYEMLNFFVK